MYQPEAFVETRAEVLAALIASHPLGLLISTGPQGLAADPVPFMFYPREGAAGVLRAHVARGNAQWRALMASPDCLVVFQGAQGYVSPSWYETKRETGKVVPTWNYIHVQARGRAEIFQDESWLRRQIEDLTGAREAGRAEAWAVSDAPEPFIRSQMRGIVGIEIAVSGLTGKWKVSQNRGAADREGVASGFRTEGATEMAEQVASRGQGIAVSD